MQETPGFGRGNLFSALIRPSLVCPSDVPWSYCHLNHPFWSCWNVNAYYFLSRFKLHYYLWMIEKCKHETVDKSVRIRLEHDFFQQFSQLREGCCWVRCDGTSQMLMEAFAYHNYLINVLMSSSTLYDYCIHIHVCIHNVYLYIYVFVYIHIYKNQNWYIYIYMYMYKLHVNTRF